jgi:hypothetical protein
MKFDGIARVRFFCYDRIFKRCTARAENFLPVGRAVQVGRPGKFSKIHRFFPIYFKPIQTVKYRKGTSIVSKFLKLCKVGYKLKRNKFPFGTNF